MKLKALLLALAVAGAGSSFALADGGHGDGHGGDRHRSSSTTASTTTSTTTTTTSSTTTTTATPTDCGRLQLRGTLASVSASSFTLAVQRASDAGRSLVGQTVTIGVDASTRVEWEGSGTLTGPNVGDLARVKATSCAGAAGGAATLTARSVHARGGAHTGYDALKSHR